MTTPNQGMPQEAPPTPGQSGSNVVAIIALIGAIIGLVTFWMPVVGLVISVVALVLAIVGMKGAAAKGGKGLAIAALVVSILGTLGGGASTACAGLLAKGAHDAAQSNGFRSFGDMMKAAADMPKKLDAAAQQAGFKNYAEWQQKDPKAAQAEAQKLGKEMGQRMKHDGEQMQKAGGDTGAAPAAGAAPATDAVHPYLLRFTNPVTGAAGGVTTYALCLFLGAGAAIVLAWALGRRRGIPGFDLLAVGGMALGGGLLGAEAFYLALNGPELVARYGWRALLGGAGFVWYGGLLGGAVAVLLYARAYGLPKAILADLAAPGLALGQAFGRWGASRPGAATGGRRRASPWPWCFRPGQSPRRGSPGTRPSSSRWRGSWSSRPSSWC